MSRIIARRRGLGGGGLVIRAELVGAGRLARGFEKHAAELNRDMERAVSGLAQDSELVFAAHALRRTGRMARGIGSAVSGSTAIVHDYAANPATGYDYVGVTRFGHRVRRIVPKRGRALAIPVGGGVIFRASTRGFRPTGDWAAQALPQIEREAQALLDAEGRRIVVDLAAHGL